MNKIVFITPSLKSGGGNRVFFELANCLCDRYNIDVVYPANSNGTNTFTINKKINFLKIGKYSNLKILKILNILKVFSYVNKNYKNVTVILSDPIMCLFIQRLCAENNIYRFLQADDYEIYEHNHVFNLRFVKALYKYFCKKSYSARVNYIFNSKFVYDIFLEVSKRKDVCCQLVYPAVNHEVFFNRKYKIRDDKISICVVGRQNRWKDLAIFQSAVLSLSPDLKKKIDKIYVISHDDLSSFTFPDWVEIVRPKSDEMIADYYNKSTIFISTSWWEGFGLPALEAMACGCSVITSDNKGCREYAVDNKNCLYFTPKRLDALLNCIEELVNSPVLRNRLALEGEKDSYKFSWMRSSEQLVDLISR